MLMLLAAATTVLTGCAHGATVRPAHVVLACGDGNFYATSLHWTAWSSRTAAATGTAHRNDCKPYCAAGHFHTYPLALRLSRPVRCVRGRIEFSRIAWTFTAAKPPGVPRSGSETLGCAFLRLKP